MITSTDRLDSRFTSFGVNLPMENSVYGECLKTFSVRRRVLLFRCHGP